MANIYRTASHPKLAVILSALITVAISALAIATAYRTFMQVQQKQAQMALANEQMALANEHAVLKRAQALFTSGSFEACINEAEQITQASALFNQAQALLNGCQDAAARNLLYEAQQFAETGQLRLAVESANCVKGRFYDLAQARIQAWSKRILDIAEQYYNDPARGLDDAVNVASAISTDNLVYGDAQSKIQQWQEEWQANQYHWQSAQAALRADMPELAFTEARQITRHPYWQRLIDPILRTAYASQREKQYEQIWHQSWAAATNGDYDNASYLATQLPDASPWDGRKAAILNQVQASRRREETWGQVFVWVAGLLLLGNLFSHYDR